MTQNIITALLTVVGSLVTYLLTRKRNAADLGKVHAETKKTELEAVEYAVTIWRELADELRKQLTTVENKCDELMEEIELLRKENRSLKADLNGLKKTINNQ